MSSLVTETQLRIYPYPSPRFWYLDPVYHTNIKLYISSLLKLKRIQFTEGSRTVQSFFVKNHPIKKVEIIAPITGIDIIRGSIIRYTEKGKGGRHNKYIDNPQFDLGTLVKVIGRLNVFNGKREIIFDTGKIYVIKDPNVEYLRWFEILTLMRDVYSKPFILPPNDMTLIYNIIDDEEANEDEAELIDDVSDEEESSDEDNDKEKKSDEDNDKEEKSDEDNAELTNNVSDKEAPFIMSKLEERLDEDNMKLIYDVSDKEDTPLIMSISEKKSDEDMQTSIPDPELFERMSILEDQSSQLTED
ncbi:34012_t:CDS:2, partial [Racocetra persica]